MSVILVSTYFRISLPSCFPSCLSRATPIILYFLFIVLASNKLFSQFLHYSECNSTVSTYFIISLPESCFPSRLSRTTPGIKTVHLLILRCITPCVPTISITPLQLSSASESLVSLHPSRNPNNERTPKGQRSSRLRLVILASTTLLGTQNYSC